PHRERARAPPGDRRHGALRPRGRGRSLEPLPPERRLARGDRRRLRERLHARRARRPHPRSRRDGLELLPLLRRRRLDAPAARRPLEGSVSAERAIAARLPVGQAARADAALLLPPQRPPAARALAARVGLVAAHAAPAAAAPAARLDPGGARRRSRDARHTRRSAPRSVASALRSLAEPDRTDGGLAAHRAKGPRRARRAIGAREHPKRARLSGQT